MRKRFLYISLYFYGEFCIHPNVTFWSEYRFERKRAECNYSSITYCSIVISKEKKPFWFPLSKDPVLSLLGIGSRLYIKEVEGKKLMSRHADRLFSEELTFAYSSCKLKLNHKTNIRICIIVEQYYMYIEQYFAWKAKFCLSYRSNVQK